MSEADEINLAEIPRISMQDLKMTRPQNLVQFLG
jgi:hypothetical protein